MATDTSTTATKTSPIESRADFADQKNGDYLYWQAELNGAAQMLNQWHKQGDRIVQRYRDQRRRNNDAQIRGTQAEGMRLNLFYANVYTQQCLLYGNVPQVDVRRRFSDAQDDRGRVASTLLERMLANDIADNEEDLDCVLRAVLEDRLLPGLGCARVRYDAEFKEVAAVVDTDGVEIQAASKELVSESAPADYYHWRDVLWGWSRTWSDLPWLAYRNYVKKDDAIKRYGKATAEQLTYKQQKMLTRESDAIDVPESDDYWLTAEIWEIWDKQTRTVVEVHLGYSKVLKVAPDPLELAKFFPSPAFFLANPTTSLYQPTPDWHLAQDLYNEVDKLQTRIAIITEAVKVVGLYDASTPDIERMLKEGTENDLIPVSTWAVFAEKGGLTSSVDWLPIKDVVDALVNLRQVRDETIALLYQVTGMSDILRGQLDNQYEGVAQTEQKTQFASIRITKLAEAFATFATGLFQLKAEVIARHFDPRTIVEQSNADELPEAQQNPDLIAEAVALIKTPKQARLKVKVEAESMASTDYLRLQGERVEFLGALSSFMQAAAPLAEQEPSAAPYLLQLLQWGLAGFRGADEIEGVIDNAIDAANKARAQAEANPQPDPEVQKEQAKAQGQIQLVQAKTQAEMQTRAQDLQADIQTESAKHQMEMQKIEAEFRQQIALIQAKANSDMAVEEHQSRINAEQQAAGVEAELNKDIIQSRVDLDAKTEEVALKIRETAATEAIKLDAKL